MSAISFQPEFRPALPVVFGAKDYQEFRDTLEQMDRILSTTGMEPRFLAEKTASFDPSASPAQVQRHAKTFHMALRYSILLGITDLSYRKLSRQVADSHLFQWFTHTNFVDAVRPVFKSTLERFEKMLSSEEITGRVHDINRATDSTAGATELLYRETALRFDEIFADTTCVK